MEVGLHDGGVLLLLRVSRYRCACVHDHGRHGQEQRSAPFVYTPFRHFPDIAWAWRRFRHADRYVSFGLLK